MAVGAAATAAARADGAEPTVNPARRAVGRLAHRRRSEFRLSDLLNLPAWRRYLAPSHGRRRAGSVKVFYDNQFD